jgi:pyruvate-formate lyase-activating enzyme
MAEEVVENKKKYEYYFDEKVTAWHRTTVVSNFPPEEMKKTIEYFEEVDRLQGYIMEKGFNAQILSEELMYETMEVMPVSENNNQETVELLMREPDS